MKKSTLLALLLALVLSVSVMVLSACDGGETPDDQPNDGPTDDPGNDPGNDEGGNDNTPVKVTISFAGGTGTMTAVSTDKEATVTLPACTLTSDNATFIGWATTEGGEVVYADGASLTASADMTLYAIFRSYDLTFVKDALTNTYLINGVVGEKTTVTIPATYQGVAVDGMDTAAFLSNGGASVTSFICEGNSFKFENGALLSGNGKTLYIYRGDAASYSNSTVETVAYAAFRGNTAITALSLSKARYISDEAFKDCTALSTIAVGSVLSCGKNAFAGTAFFNNADNWTDGLLTLSSGNGTAKKMLLIAANNTVSGDIQLDAYVQTIADYAFAGNTAITSVKTGANLRTIGAHAFDGCTALVTIRFNDYRPENIKVNSIGAYAFADCTALESFTLPIDLENIYEGTFANTTSMKYFVMAHKNTSYMFHHGSLTACAATEVFYTGDKQSEALWDVNGPYLKDELPAGLKVKTIHYYKEAQPTKSTQDGETGYFEGRHWAWCYVNEIPTLWNDILQ